MNYTLSTDIGLRGVPGQTDFVDGQRIQITGHFDDAVADDCRMAVGDPPVAEPDKLARMACQSRFVATEVKVL